MFADGGLVSPVQELEPVGDFPVAHLAGDVDKEPGDQGHHQHAGHDLQSPLDYPGMAPDRHALVSKQPPDPARFRRFRLRHRCV